MQKQWRDKVKSISAAAWQLQAYEIHWIYIIYIITIEERKQTF